MNKSLGPMRMMLAIMMAVAFVGTESAAFDYDYDTWRPCALTAPAGSR